MNSLVLITATRFMLPLILVFSVFLLLHGHNEPGGGFTGGLTGGTAFTLYALTHGTGQARRLLCYDPGKIIGAGLIVAILSGVPAIIVGDPFLTGKWGNLGVLGVGTLYIGTPIFFDLGVYLVVLGTASILTFNLLEEEG